VRWTNGSEFLSDLKLVITMIYNDDSMSMDERSYEIRISKLMEEFEKMVLDNNLCASKF
jgi:hypothetical protein